MMGQALIIVHNGNDISKPDVKLAQPQLAPILGHVIGRTGQA